MRWYKVCATESTNDMCFFPVYSIAERAQFLIQQSPCYNAARGSAPLGVTTLC
jgi:hypothetical protein